MIDPATGVGLQVASSLYSFGKSRKAAKQAKKAGRAAAKLIKEETAETLRRKEIADAFVEGEGVARLAASGMRLSGTPNDYLNFLAEQRDLENAWTMRSGKLRAKQAKYTGTAQADALRDQGIMDLMGAGMNIYQTVQRGLTSPIYGRNTSESLTVKPLGGK